MITTKQLSLCRDHEKTRQKNYNNAWPLRTSVNFYLMKTYLFICIIFLNTQILPGVKVIIANTETKGPLGDSHLGEVSVKYESE